MNLLVIWDQRSLNYTMGVIIGLIDVSLFAKLISSLEFTISFTVVLAGKVRDLSLRIKIQKGLSRLDFLLESGLKNGMVENGSILRS